MGFVQPHGARKRIDQLSIQYVTRSSRLSPLQRHGLRRARHKQLDWKTNQYVSDSCATAQRFWNGEIGEDPLIPATHASFPSVGRRNRAVPKRES